MVQKFIVVLDRKMKDWNGVSRVVLRARFNLIICVMFILYLLLSRKD